MYLHFNLSDHLENVDIVNQYPIFSDVIKTKTKLLHMLEDKFGKPKKGEYLLLSLYLPVSSSDKIIFHSTSYGPNMSITLDGNVGAEIFYCPYFFHHNSGQSYDYISFELFDYIINWENLDGLLYYKRHDNKVYGFVPCYNHNYIAYLHFNTNDKYILERLFKCPKKDKTIEKLLEIFGDIIRTPIKSAIK